MLICANFCEYCLSKIYQQTSIPFLNQKQKNIVIQKVTWRNDPNNVAYNYKITWKVSVNLSRKSENQNFQEFEEFRTILVRSKHIFTQKNELYRVLNCQLSVSCSNFRTWLPKILSKNSFNRNIRATKLSSAGWCHDCQFESNLPAP